MRIFKKVFAKEFNEVPFIMYDLEGYEQTVVRLKRGLFWELDINKEYKLICRDSIYFIKHGLPYLIFNTKGLKGS